MNIVVDGLLTQYTITGKGKLILLLHGWGDSARGLAGLQEHLAASYRVLSLDLPGFGGSQAPDGVWDLDNYAHFLENVLAKLKFKQPDIVIGHSNGGALAIRAVSMQCLKPKKLVLLAASGVRTGGGLKRLVLKLIAKTGNVATLWLPERYRQALRKSLYGAAGSDMLVVPQLQATFKKTVRQDVQADAAAITVPTLLIYGTNDRAVPVSDGRTYHRLIANSRLELLDDAGHFVHLEQTSQVQSLIEEFLK